MLNQKLHTLLSCFIRPKPVLNEPEARRLSAWSRIPPASPTLPLAQTRCIVVDVETSGLNPSRDRLLAIGAVAVTNNASQLSDSFEIVLQQRTASSGNNILVHGISGSTQVSGIPPREALLRFLEFLGNAPLIAFHARFDQTILERAMQEFLGLRFKHAWLDMACILPALYPDKKYASLDEWLTHFHIDNYARHNALSDAVATAQLFLIAQKKWQEQDIDRFKDLLDLEKAYLLREP